ncbi:MULTISPECIES: hypothetical protein [Sphingobacterium]|uniref:hypothetical protein n=1 Tax=Sphingobacterium TaxID=28453 RepID=UPI0025795604|nr:MULTISPECIES: hypothetical protein [Sphingobacterium]
MNSKFPTIKTLPISLVLAVGLSFTACGQSKTQKSETTTKEKQKMDTNQLTNETVKAAFGAWQKGDSKTFLSYFATDAKLYDDGNPRNFQNFVKEACGRERFTSIEKVENEGKDITGNFHTESWGDFKTYFKFSINSDGKFDRLDIGQAK